MHRLHGESIGLLRIFYAKLLFVDYTLGSCCICGMTIVKKILIIFYYWK